MSYSYDEMCAAIESSLDDGVSDAISWVLRDQFSSPAFILKDELPPDMQAMRRRAKEHRKLMEWRYSAWCLSHNIAIAAAIGRR